ncbi:MAG: hypothetical protein PHU23_14600 [Dehalococcoidales bacterium]|nr:hypothetical protein [Dehalococcoidales bacterium]
MKKTDFKKDQIGFEKIIALARQAIEKGRFNSASKILMPLLACGNPEAEFLSAGYSVGDETESQFDKRRLMLIQSAAQKKYPPALYKLGFFYDVGEIVNQDKKMAAKLFREAAELGYAHAQYIYAMDLLDGTNGIATDVGAGLDWLHKSVSNKFEGAIVLLAELYQKGLYGLPKNIEMANKLLLLLKDEDLITW